MNKILISVTTLLTVLICTDCLVPAKFQWKIIDFAWKHESLRDQAIADGSYIPENNMPTGLARWRDKLFITIPRWKKGVPCSLNYVYVNGPQHQPLRPYPSWGDAFVTDKTTTCPSNSTVVSTFRVAVDDSDRLWVVDNGVTDMASEVKQIAEPAILVFDLKTDRLLHRYVFGDELRNTSVLTSIVVDDTCGCDNSTFAYITDMGSNALIVYDLHYDEAWRVESPHFLFDPSAGVYRVGGVDFYWSDGVSSAVLSSNKRDGYRDLYVQPTSSTKTFKIPTSVATNKHASGQEKLNSVQVVGDRGLKSQATACDVDRTNNIMFFTQLSKNGISCWNMDKPLTPENTPLIISDCNLLEFPNDVKVDKQGILWILSDRQSRFLYSRMDFNQTNFRVLAAPAAAAVAGSACAPRPSRAQSLRNIFRRSKSKELDVDCLCNTTQATKRQFKQ